MPSLNKIKSQLYADSFYCKNLTSEFKSWIKKREWKICIKVDF